MAAQGAFRADCSNRALIKEVNNVYMAIFEGWSATECGCGWRRPAAS